MSRCEHFNGEHDAMKAPEAWSTLPFVGVQKIDGVAVGELRNAPCGSTLMIELHEEE